MSSAYRKPSYRVAEEFFLNAESKAYIPEWSVSEDKKLILISSKESSTIYAISTERPFLVSEIYLHTKTFSQIKPVWSEFISRPSQDGSATLFILDEPGNIWSAKIQVKALWST